MSNMHYCQFENTYNDLTQCIEAIENGEELSEEEEIYKQKLISLCQKLLELTE